MKIDKEFILNFLQSNFDYLSKEFGISSISLFGSFTLGEETDESDIDLFVDMPSDPHKLLGLIEYLEKNFQRKVDIVINKKHLKERFLKRIQEEKIVV